MSIESLLALAAFAFVTSVTPGPSNLILLAAGANFGFHRSAHLVLAVTVSFLSMILVVGMGLGQLLRMNESIDGALKLLSLLYILWLAWKIASSAAIEPEAPKARPLGFFEMALLQWVNPKAWAVALAVTAAYTTPTDYPTSLLLLTLVFGIVNLPSISIWAAFGAALRRWLSSPRRVRAFNLTMAVLLVVSMLPVVFHIAPPPS